jgi:hypothetical protein
LPIKEITMNEPVIGKPWLGGENLEGLMDFIECQDWRGALEYAGELVRGRPELNGAVAELFRKCGPEVQAGWEQTGIKPEEPEPPQPKPPKPEEPAEEVKPAAG